MAYTATDFFATVLGGSSTDTSHGGDPAAIQEVLSHKVDRLSFGEKELLIAPLTLDELGETTQALANKKCPRLDGTPAEFYKANWNSVGPLVLQCLSTGINEEHLPYFITKGWIVLLPKKSDQRLLVNKCPITLLNTCYKIGAKALQRRLTTILQQVISYHQSTFLPGRNIHHALLY